VTATTIKFFPDIACQRSIERCEWIVMAKRRRGSLPKSELEVTRIVWNLGEATVRQVLETLPEEREIDF